MKDEEWNPGYLSYVTFPPTWINYYKSWYCNYKKIIHTSEKEYDNCKECKEGKEFKQKNKKLL